ncbi:MAG: FAD-dependent oxidoreductase [Nostoc sp.]|uniref:FAD-dependent oxidoreductase n=1 Tax=Nostoc sp. TaxID=1180 RepID=UPI002FFA34AC
MWAEQIQNSQFKIRLAPYPILPGSIQNPKSKIQNPKLIDGYLFPPDLKSIDEIQQELEAVHRVGLTNVEMVKKAPLSDFYTGVCLRFPQQGQFDPLKYLTGLAEAIQRRGGRIYPEAHVEKIPGGLPARVETSSGKVVRADAVVVATNSPNEVTSVENK